MWVTKFSPGVQSHTSSSTLYPASCSCQASHSAHAVSRLAWLMKKSVPRPLTQQPYTYHPRYGYPGGPDPTGRTPSPRARRKESLLVLSSPAPSARVTVQVLGRVS